MLIRGDYSRNELPRQFRELILSDKYFFLFHVVALIEVFWYGIIFASSFHFTFARTLQDELCGLTRLQMRCCKMLVTYGMLIDASFCNVIYVVD